MSSQDNQFTSDAFTARLQAANVAISWDGRGSYFDNIFIECLWRSVKYEEVYLKTMTPLPRLGVDWETISTFTINSGFINRSIIEHPTRCISNNFRRFTLTELVGFYILNPTLFCLKNGGKFKVNELERLMKESKWNLLNYSYWLLYALYLYK